MAGIIDRQLFQSSTWCQALTLAERHALITKRDQATPDNGKVHPIADPAAAQRRLNRWRTQAPFTVDIYFAQRLAQLGVSEEEFLTALSEPVENLHHRLTEELPWVAQLRDAFLQAEEISQANSAEQETPASTYTDLPPAFMAEEDAEADAGNFQEGDAEDEFESGEEDTGVLNFLELLRPLIDQAIDEILAEVERLQHLHPHIPFDPEEIHNILFPNLPEPLLMRISRTLVLELNVARLQGHLQGETPQERFTSFIERLRDPNVSLAILAEYPVLTRQLVQRINQWAAVNIEFLQRLCNDWPLLRQQFSPDQDPGMLVELSGGEGDTHRNGRSVMIATFESGLRIVYKPRSLLIDIHFQELIEWVNDHGCNPRLRTMHMLDREDYGWVEFVAYATCNNEDELKRFFRRHGTYLAILYAIHSNDFHYENLIAVGEHPLLIDLETLFLPNFDNFDETIADLRAEKMMAESVLQVGLLPMRMWSSDGYGGIDISGLGGMTGQLSPDRLLQLADVGTDAMRYIRDRVEISGVANRPSINGEEVSAADYIDEILMGFVSMYQRILDHREELLAEDGPMMRFASDEIRVLLRPTRTYDQLLSESFHPDLLRNQVERDRFFDRLWMQTPFRPYLTHVIPSELAELQRGDIPMFTSRPTTQDLYGFHPEGIPNVLYESGMTVARNRILQLNEKDLHQQIWFIRASISTLESSYHLPTATVLTTTKRATPFHVAAPTGAQPNREQLLTHVNAIANHLTETAILGQEDVSWLGLDLIEQQNWGVRTVSVDLHNGLAGIALFLGYAGLITGNEAYTQLAQRGHKTLIGQMQPLQTGWAIGAFDGWGGILHALNHFVHLWPDQGIHYQARGVANIIAELVEQDTNFDIARGSAGAILPLLALHQYLPESNALEIAIACGDHLLQGASHTSTGDASTSNNDIDNNDTDNSDASYTWAIPPIGIKPPCALLYGNLGIAWALFELAAATHQERFANAAKQAIQTALKTRTSTTLKSDALALLAIRPHLANDPKLAPAIQDALQSSTIAMTAYRTGQSHALHHGDLGTLELLHQLGQDTETLTAQLTATILTDAETNGWQCGGVKGVLTPSFMFGLSGIGYGLLRRIDPERVPSPLLLASPARQREAVR